MPVARVEITEIPGKAETHNNDNDHDAVYDEEEIVGALLAALDKPLFLRELHELAKSLTASNADIKLTMDDTRDMLIDSDCVVYCPEEMMMYPKLNEDLVAEAFPPIPENSPYGRLLARHEARFAKDEA